MIQCSSLDQARAVPGVIAIEAGTFKAYVSGDALPPYMVVTSPTIPQEVTMRQARLALNAAGKLAAVQTAINGMVDPNKTNTQIWWDYSSVVQRGQPIVASLGAAIGLDSAGIDNLFTTAATL